MESCWAASRYGVETQPRGWETTTSIPQWNISTCLDGWIGYRACCPVACLAVCCFIGAFLTDASFAWPGETLCEHNHLARTSGSHCVTATSITAATAETRQTYHRGSTWPLPIRHGRSHRHRPYHHHRRRLRHGRHLAWLCLREWLQHKISNSRFTPERMHQKMSGWQSSSQFRRRRLTCSPSIH